HRVVQRVTHVQNAGDVRERDRDRVVLVRRPLGLWEEQPRLEPSPDDPRLDLGWVIARLGLEVGERPGGGHREASVGAGDWTRLGELLSCLRDNLLGQFIFTMTRSPGSILRDARRSAGLSQASLAARL